MRLNFSENAIKVFSEMKTDYESMNNLMQDLALGKEIYDNKNKKVISNSEANSKILAFSKKILGITSEKPSRKEIRRAFRDNGREWFDIIEDTIDVVVSTGFDESEWFNALSETRNIAYGDRQDFYVDDECILAVAKAGESHHDHIIQRLKPGSPVSIPTHRYVVKVGADINKYIVGQVDWSALISAIARAYMLQIQTDVYAEIGIAAATLPSIFLGTGTLSTATKPQFDAIIDNVSAANSSDEVVIMGTKAALRKLNAIADVQWLASSQKETFANTGVMGIYEGTRLVETPNKFKDRNLNAKIFDDDKLYIIPLVDNKMIKIVDEGDTEIVEATEKGELMTDIMTYEVQRRFGVGSVVGRYFGEWDM